MNIKKERIISCFTAVVLFVSGVVCYAAFPDRKPAEPVRVMCNSATGMAMSVIFVLVMSGAITWALNEYILKPSDLEYLQTLSFILVIAVLVSFVEMFLKKPSLNYIQAWVYFYP